MLFSGRQNQRRPLFCKTLKMGINMRPRKLFVIASKLVLMSLFVLLCAPRTLAQTDWAVVNTFHIGGDGGWDYVTADPENHRLYVPRSTHTMVIDTESGKTI